MKLAHRAGGHSWAENADMSSLKGGVFPLRRKQKGFICEVYTSMSKAAASKAAQGGRSPPKPWPKDEAPRSWGEAASSQES